MRPDRVAEPSRSAAGPGLAVPAATRVSSPGWRDPRMWIGLLIVAASVLVGARVLAAADDTVAVWAVAADVGAGAELTTADLEAHRVRFADAEDLMGYFATADELPARLLLVRPVGAGELLPRAAIGDPEIAADTVELPIAVEPEQVPPSVAAGSVVSVYLLAGPAAAAAKPGGATAAGPAEPLLAEATVVAAPNPESAFGSVSNRRQLVLAVPEEDAAAFLGAVSARGGGEQAVLTVLRRS